MQSSQFTRSMNGKKRPVILVEGVRALPEAVAEQAVQAAVSASPGCAAMMNNRMRIPSLAAKARYLMRDTVKVIGSLDHGLAPADAGLFFVNSLDPMKGGTGHTMRVCREMKVPVFDQVIWREWLG